MKAYVFAINLGREESRTIKFYSSEYMNMNVCIIVYHFTGIFLNLFPHYYMLYLFGKIHGRSPSTPPLISLFSPMTKHVHIICRRDVGASEMWNSHVSS